MIISLNWLKKFTNIDTPIDKLSELIGARLVEIEEVIDLAPKYKDILIVKVVTADKIDGSDHLSVLKIDDGKVAQGIERDLNSYIQVVCGAPNVKAGQLVVWLPPKSIVPSSYNEPEQFVLDSRNLRGIKSNGMIASAKELDLFDEHTGILVVDRDIQPGTLFADAYELNDQLLNIENKSLTHRPDCFGIIGFAREVAAISGIEFNSPKWLTGVAPKFGQGSDKINISIDDKSLSDRYTAIIMDSVNCNKQSPLQIQMYLARVGVRPINAVVDVTNYLMMLTGQPLHAFDYDKFLKVAGGKCDIHVRAGKPKEKLELLDGKVIELSSDDIVIAAGEKAVALAGAMGGANTEIDEKTTKILIESATFNLYKLRGTQMRHGIFSEAITRFTKGQPADLAMPVLAEAVRLMSQWVGATVASMPADSYPGKIEKQSIKISPAKVNEVLGSSFDLLQITEPLTRTEFKVNTRSPKSIIINAPYWRSDIHIPEDIIEEVGRINGYDNIKPTLPVRNFTAVRPSEFDIFRSKVRESLVRAGSNEVLSYSFIHGDILQKAGQKQDDSYKIVNSISPDLQYYRQSLTPSLLNLAYINVKQGYDEFALFELNKVHKKSDGLNEEKVPIENDNIALVVTNKLSQSGAAYYKAKRILDHLCNSLGMTLDYVPIMKDSANSLSAPFEYRRSAIVSDKKSGLFIGIVGEYKSSVVKGFKIPENSAGFELNLMSLFNVSKKLERNYTPVSRFPGSERDICFQVADDINYSQIIDSAQLVLTEQNIVFNISPVDIYKGKDTKSKNITIRVKLTANDHTLTSDEVAGIIDKVISGVVKATDAKVI